MHSVKFSVLARSKTTFKTDSIVIEVFDGQDAMEVANRVAAGYGATVEAIDAWREDVGVMHTLHKNSISVINPAWLANPNRGRARLEILATAGYFTKDGEKYCTTDKFDAFYK